MLSKAGSTRWSVATGTVKWEPDEVTIGRNFVQDCEGRCVENTGSTILKNDPESNFAQIRVLLVFSEAVSLETFKTAFDVYDAYIPVCPFQESFKSALFPMNDHLLKDLMTNRIIAWLSEGPGLPVPSHRIPSKIESITRFVTKR